MHKLKAYLNRIFIEGLGGMAYGLFATLIVGTIIQQIGKLIGGNIGETVIALGKIASYITGAGIGCGVAYRLKESPLILLSAGVAGMIGAYAQQIASGTLLIDGVIQISGPGEPLGAFIAAFISIEAGRIISGKTKVDILVTPMTSILSGSIAGLFVGPPISSFMNWLGTIINWGTEQQPFIMGIIVSVIMGIVLTLPISSAALGIILNLSGLAAGAATVGCCANMIGFAVASYKDNGGSGFLAQGLGTSMLQVPNIVRKPVIWMPAIVSSAILGPVSTLLFQMTNNPTGSGMGTSGLVGQIMTYQTMTSYESPSIVLIKIALLHFLLPGLISYITAGFMFKKDIIREGDMKLEL